jgi:cell division septum initiation protein DivIVA
LTTSESEALVVPGTGEVVDLNDECQCIAAYAAVVGLEDKVKEAKRMLTAAIAERSRVLGQKTITAGAYKAEVRGGQKTQWDAQALERDLRALGMPEERIREVVREEVTYTVSAMEARRISKANADYAAVVAANKHEVEMNTYVAVRKA